MARQIAELLEEVDDEKATYYAELLEEHAEDHSFEDRFEEIGPLDEFIKQHT